MVVNLVTSCKWLDKQRWQGHINILNCRNVHEVTERLDAFLPKENLLYEIFVLALYMYSIKFISKSNSIFCFLFWLFKMSYTNVFCLEKHLTSHLVVSAPTYSDLWPIPGTRLILPAITTVGTNINWYLILLEFL